MTAFIVLLCVVLLGVVSVQIGKVSELATKIRGEEVVQQESNLFNARFGVIFMVLFLILSVGSAWYYKDYMLGYGPLQNASIHADEIRYIFNITLFFTGIVFVLTQILLFWYAYKYRAQKGRVAEFISHNNRLEVIWTAIPALVMTFLVVGGLSAWNDAMADVKEGDDYLEFEATGYQFAWALRYPGADGLLGTKDYRLITAENQLGVDWKDKKNLDDFQPDEVVLPVNKKVRVRITAKDVLHNFYLPHFAVKMDAIPGLPTYFVFTPTKTTEEYRQNLKKYPEWNEPYDLADPTGPKKWEKFDYELACAELCGKGHFSMRKIVKVVSQEEFNAWSKSQKSFYEQNVKGKPGDPWMTAQPANENVGKAMTDAIENARKITDASTRIIRLDHVFFETGKDVLTSESKVELNSVVEAMKKYPTMALEISGHTDNVGNPASNLTLSEGRSKAVLNYLTSNGVDIKRLTAKGYGDTKPVVSNDNEEGRAQNRRTEVRIINL